MKKRKEYRFGSAEEIIGSIDPILPDKRIVTASFDKTARVWNVDGTGEPQVLYGHDGWVVSAAWSPDGKHIVTASRDKTVRVWNADGTDDPLVLRGHKSKVTSAAWNPDGKRIVSASQRRIELLNVSDATARADQQTCERRVNEARAASTKPY